MKKILALVLLVCCVVGVLDWWLVVKLPKDAVLADGSKLEWRACDFKLSGFKVVHCGRLSVTAASGQQHQLALVMLKQRRWYKFWQDHKDPILFLNGGPGLAGELDKPEMIEYWFDQLSLQGWDHDLLLYDQRGVGLSQPAVVCPEWKAFIADNLELNTPAEQLWQQAHSMEQRCVAELKRQGLVLSDFSTRNSAADAIRLMQAVGAGSWNIYAVSYGTRLALEILKTPDLPIRSLILDSVYPLSANGFLGAYQALNDAVTELELACVRDELCQQHNGSVMRNLEQIMDNLQQQPLSLEVNNWQSRKTIAVTLDAQGLAAVLTRGLSDWREVQNMPAMLAALRDGKVTPEWQRLVEFYINETLDPGLSEAAYMVIECNDNPIFSEQQYLAALTPYRWLFPEQEKYFQYNNCSNWQNTATQTLQPANQRSTVPTLLLSGRFDPLTPLAWGRAAAQTFSKVYVFAVDGVGHAVINSDDCSQQLARAFLAQPNLEPVADCDVDLPPEFDAPQ